LDPKVANEAFSEFLSKERLNLNENRLLHGSIIFVGVRIPLIKMKNTQSPCFFILELAKKQEKNGVACNMNCNIVISGLKDVVIKKVEDIGETINIYVEMLKRVHRYPKCGWKTSRIHDYRIQKIKHLKWFEQRTLIFYRRRSLAGGSALRKKTV